MKTFKGLTESTDIKATLKAMDSSEYSDLKNAYNDFMDGYFALVEISKSIKDPAVKKEIGKVMKSPGGKDQLGKYL